MVLTFEYLLSCKESGRLIQVFETLLQSFQKTVLTAYKSKFAQFVMFYSIWSRIIMCLNKETFIFSLGTVNSRPNKFQKMLFEWEWLLLRCCSILDVFAGKPRIT